MGVTLKTPAMKGDDLASVVDTHVGQRASAARNRDVDAIGFGVDQRPEPGCGGVAEDCVGARVEESCPKAPAQ